MDYVALLGVLSVGTAICVGVWYALERRYEAVGTIDGDEFGLPNETIVVQAVKAPRKRAAAKKATKKATKKVAKARRK